jgi:two-component system invasion response regulator UvrY
MITILIADDHPVVRQGIKQIVHEAGDMRVVDEAVTSQQVLEGARSAPDVILLDLSMPGTDGLDVLKQLKREHPRLAVLIFTLHSEDQFAIRALKAGACGYLTKDASPAELIVAIRRVATGGRYISALVAEKLAVHLGSEDDLPAHEHLSDREYQILCLIATGHSTRDISTQLSLSIKTISTYRARVMDKLQMKNTAELAAYVVRNHLAD